MGYCMDQTDGKFEIKIGNFHQALEALRGLIGKGGYDGRWSWVDTSDLEAATNLGEILESFRWKPTFDEHGNINSLNFTGEKYSYNEQEIFNAIAPFVTEGSFIQMQGEDGALWRWAFNGTTCVERSAQIVWDS